MRHLLSIAALLALASPLGAQCPNVHLPATGGGYYVVVVNGDTVSQHTTERAAAARGVTEKLRNPTAVVTYNLSSVTRVEGCMPTGGDTVTVPDTVFVPSPPQIITDTLTIGVPVLVPLDSVNVFPLSGGSFRAFWDGVVYRQVPVVPPPPPPPTSLTVAVDTTTRLQRMRGWEAVAQAGDDAAGYQAWRVAVLDSAAAYGINRIRLEVRSGAENDADYDAQFAAGQITNAVWKTHRYSPVNDNGDPNVLNAAGFHWTTLDQKIDDIIAPMRVRVPGLYVELTYVSFGGANMLTNNGPEYAEFMLALFQHVQAKYGWVPDGVNIILEADNNTGWTGTGIGQAIAAAGARLAAAGFTPDFGAPATMSMAQAVPYFDGAWANTAARPYLKELTYHRYAGVSDASLNAIRQRATEVGITTGMSEHIGSGVEDLYKDLTLGGVSHWEQFTLAYPTSDNGAQYFPIVGGQVTVGSRTYGLSQYFRYVPRGSYRVAATGNANVRPVAFTRPDGGTVVVLHVDGPQGIVVGGLRPGVYDVTRSTATGPASGLGTVTADANGVAVVTVPSSSIVTLAPVGTVPPPPPVDTTPPPPVDTLPTPIDTIPSGLPPHPRVWMTPERVQHLKNQATANTSRWQVVKRYADQQVAKGTAYGSGDYGLLGSICSAYLATGNQAYADRAAVVLTNYAVPANDLRRDSGYDFRFNMPVVTMGLDWCYNGLPIAVRQQTAGWLMDRADWAWTETNPVVDAGLNKRYGIDRPTNNYWWGFAMTGPAGLASIGDDPRGTAHAALGRVRWSEAESQAFSGPAAGGVWTEGTGYDVSWYVGRFADAYLTAGQPVTSPWLVQSLLWRIHSTTPDGKHQVPFGDQARVSTGPIYDYDRLRVLDMVPASGASAPLRSQAKFWLDMVGSVPSRDDRTAKATDELLHYDPAAPSSHFSTLPRSYRADGQGVFVWRSDWTPSATMLAFKAGTRAEGHQDGAANSLMLWHGSFWVAANANIYSHSGIRHETQYYNTLTVSGSQWGQQLTGPSELLTVSDTPSLVVMRGQAAQSYGRDGYGRPVNDFLRTVAWLPDLSVAVVVDRVTITNPADTMIVRWHGYADPAISGNRFTVANPNGDQRCVGDASSRNAMAVVSEPQLIGQNMANSPPSSYAAAIRTTGNASDVIVTVIQCGAVVGMPVVTRASDAVTVSIAGATVRVPLAESEAVSR